MTRARLGIPLALLALVACQGGPRGPRAEADAWFPHPTHLEAGLECQDCHESATASSQAADNLLPRVATCLDCHESDDPAHSVFARPAQSRVPGVYRGRDLLFPHAIHTEALECDACHAAATSPPGSSLVPPMDSCLECHDAQPCSRCHVQLEHPRYRPRSHDPFWLQKHALVTRSEQADCSGCHRESWCQDCHQGDIESRYHNVTFRQTHGLEARIAPSSCQSCHRLNFCQNCHAQVGVSQ